MLVHRRIALACATIALALAPATAHAMPAIDPPAPKPAPKVVVAAQPSAAPVVRTDSGDTTLALVLSGSALLIAAGAAALSSHDHRRIGKVV
jgi:hypothetical protein